ncbi:DNA polymerase III subunit beta [Roseibium aggregatum]|uniref:DNA polymerase III subunit beta n=1 Tax=Roseibium aggregatum TaxID=187304 RepID=UPI001E4956EA|nr:DNA polymerase III subunit beta [Roseibium aggregatum]
MHIETTAGELRKALKIVEPAVVTRSALPILSTVLFDGATVTGCDMNLQIRADFAATKASGKAALQFFQLKRIVSALPMAESLCLASGSKSGAGRVTLTFSGGCYDLLSMPHADFPALATPPAVEEIPVPDGFTRSLKAVRAFISTEETRYYLNGICLSKNERGVPVAVATDGHRLGAHETGLDVAGNPILPHMTVAALCALPNPTHCAFVVRREGKGGDDKASVPTWSRFRFPGIELVSKLIDGTFPDWKRVVPNIEADHPKMTLDRVETLAALRRLSSSPLNKSVMLAAEGNIVVACRTSADEDMRGSERLAGASVENWPGGFLFCFNGSYLRDLLIGHRPSETVTLTGQSRGAPCVVTGAGNDYVTVLMPMRSEDETFARHSLGLFGGGKLSAVA